MLLSSSCSRRLFSVVIASVCDDARFDQLKRACESVRNMARGHDYLIIVVANGSRVSPSVINWLEAEPDVCAIRLRTGSYPLARRFGAEIANCEFLAFLDDDDELLPDTLAQKITYFRENPGVDVLVTDGLRVNGSSVTKIFPELPARSSDLIETIIRAGWSAGAITLRTQNMDLAAFDPVLRHLEWTSTTLELARRYKFGFVDQPMYRYHEDTAGSLSKSVDFRLAGPELWRKLISTYADTPYANAVRRRHGVVCRNVSGEYAKLGRLREAWSLYAESLRSPGAIAFVPYSLKLIFASLRHLFA